MPTQGTQIHTNVVDLKILPFNHSGGLCVSLTPLSFMVSQVIG